MGGTVLIVSLFLPWYSFGGEKRVRYWSGSPWPQHVAD